jgi:hypothetical protein
MITDSPPNKPPPQTCPTCGQPLRHFALPVSHALEWVEVLHDHLDTLHADLHALRAVLERAVLP